jgi:hypothetical protein
VIIILLQVMVVSLPQALAHPHHLLVSNSTGSGSGLEVNSTHPLAQGFQVSGRYFVTRASVNVSDIGLDDALTLEIREDGGGAPSLSVLGSAVNNSGNGYSWVSFDFSSPPILQPSTTYWLVALSSEGTGDGYLWATSGSDAYPNGSAARGELDSWSLVSDDLHFRVEGFADWPLEMGATAASPWVSLSGKAGFVVFVNNTGTETAPKAWVNMTLASGLTYSTDYFPSTSFGHSLLVSGSMLSYTLTSIPSGRYTFLVNATAATTLRAGTLLNSTASFTSVNSTGVLSASTSTVVTHIVEPILTLAKVTNLTTVRRDSTLTYRIYFNVTGVSAPRDVWINDTLDPKLVLKQERRSNGTLLIEGNTLSWRFQDVQVGSHFLEIDSKTIEGAPHGYIIYNLATADYTDGSGLHLGRVVSNRVASTVSAPRVEVHLNQSRGQAEAGGRVSYKIVVTNTGGEASKRVYLNTTLDTHLRLLNYTFPLPPSLRDGTYSWLLSDLRAGEVRTYTMEVQVEGNTPPGSIITMTIWYSYSGPTGEGWYTSRSREMRLQVPTGAGFLSHPLVLPLLLASPGLGYLGYLLVRGRPRVQEAFLVYKNGLLLSHVSRTNRLRRDEDILTGMLTAVQNVLREGFAYDGQEELKHLDLGPYKGIIERGEHVYLAVFYSGRGGNSLSPRMRKLIQRLEEAYKGKIEKWTGELSQLPGIEDFLPANLRLEGFTWPRRSSF